MNTPTPEAIEPCPRCDGDAFVWTRPGLLGTPFTEVICPDCGGSGLSVKPKSRQARRVRKLEFEKPKRMR